MSGQWLTSVILAIWEAEIRRIEVHGPVQANSLTPSQDNQGKIDWRCGSSDRASALQVQSPEFKAHSYSPPPQKKSIKLGESILS
jgi:hypothetical protein